MNRQEILDCLEQFPYDRKEYWVITGGAMALYGIRKQTADIDLGCTTAMADRLETDGCLCQHMEKGKRRFKYGEKIEIFENWIYDSIETVNGFQIISVRGLIEMKQELGRDKDQRDIELIKTFLNKR